MIYFCLRIWINKIFLYQLFQVHQILQRRGNSAQIFQVVVIDIGVAHHSSFGLFDVVLVDLYEVSDVHELVPVAYPPIQHTVLTDAMVHIDAILLLPQTNELDSSGILVVVLFLAEGEVPL